VAYIMSRFPKLTETFILYEMLVMEEMGISVEIYPLLREHQNVAHAESERWVRRAHYIPFLSLPILQANWHYLLQKPLTYLKTWMKVLSGTFGSSNFFFGALGILPKSVYFAYKIEKQGVHHVHAHFATHPAVSALIINSLTGIPFSFTAHGSDLHVDRRMLKQKVETAAFVITISAYNKEMIAEECGESTRAKIHIIHCGVDLDVFAPSPQKPNNASFEILCTASYEEVKGHRYLVEACRLLKERGLRFTCHLVGEGPLRRQIEKQIANAGLNDVIRMHGGLPRTKIKKMLSSADVVVLASVPTSNGKREGIPVVLMEAMASGLPVVASGISGIPELVDDNVSGFLTAPRDAAALADALDKLSSNPELRMRMGRNGRTKVEREFSLRTNTENLARLFLRSNVATSQMN